jgi:uncharacterized protein (DUF2461 family)
MKSKSGPRFSGFHPEAFRFFRRMARNNRKPWFDRHRHIYDQHISGALRALFEELVPFVLSLDDDFEISGKTGRNFSRINRDIRFARTIEKIFDELFPLYAFATIDGPLGERALRARRRR